MRVLLGIDTGTHSTKGVACLPDGSLVAEARTEHSISVPRPGFAEQDPDLVWWRDFCIVASRLVAALPRGVKVDAIASSACGPCLVALDHHGVPLRPAMLYGVDARAGVQIAKLEARIGRAAITRLSGSRLSSQHLGPKILWLYENEPDVFARTDKFVTATSYVVFRLTGCQVVDQHHAAYFSPFVDLKHARWDLRYADGLLNESSFPKLCWSNEIVGTVHSLASKETGLPEGTPVVAGSTDGLAEALSVGVVKPGDVMVMYGSAGSVILVLDQPKPAPNMWLSAGVFPGEYVLAGGPSTSGSITTWFREELARDLPQGNTKSIGDAHQTLTSEADESVLGSHGLLMLPYFSGERSPVNDPAARGVLVGLSLSHTRGDIYRAILEASAYAVRHTLEVMESAGAPVKRLVAVGGGSVSRLWLQIMSDVTGFPQDVPAGRIGASYGDAFLAALAVGAVTGREALGHWVRIEHRVEPDARAMADYDYFYRLYRSLYARTRPIVHALATGPAPRSGARPGAGETQTTGGPRKCLP